MIYPSEEWKTIDYDSRYQVSNFGRFRKKNPKNGYRYLKPYRKHNKFVIHINDKEMTCARLVANYFIKKLTDDDCVYHKNKLEFDNYYKNLIVMSRSELNKKVGHLSRSKRVVEVKDGEIVREWRSSRKAAKCLFVSHQTVNDYCNKKVKNPMFNLMWEDDYFDEVFPKFSWEKNRRKL